MAFTTEYNLPEMPSGAVDWPAVINDLVHKLEVGRTMKLTAGEALTKGAVIYISSSDGKAYKADGTTNKARGIWQTLSSAINSEGYAQVDGYMDISGATYTKGGLIYSSATGTLTQTANGPAIGFAKTDVRIFIILHLDAE